MLSDFGIVLLFIVASMVALSLVLGISKMLRPSKPNGEKLTTYESGEDPIGQANIQFNVRYYIVALIFILFDVELVFLFPWATVFGQKQLIEQSKGWWGWFSLAEMVIFILILAIGLAYAWGKGYLDWVRTEQKPINYKGKVPMDLYEQVNEKYGAKKIIAEDVIQEEINNK
jgi:NADH-quinone oxidoreductase subunit A